MSVGPCPFAIPFRDRKTVSLQLADADCRPSGLRTTQTIAAQRLPFPVDEGSRQSGRILSRLVSASAQEAVDLGTRLEPWIDDYLIANLHNLKQTLHEPVRREVALVNDSPWEGNLRSPALCFGTGTYRL